MTPSNDNVRLVSINDIVEMTSLSRTAISKFRRRGQFPLEVNLGDRRIGFVKAEIEAWIAERVARRDAGARLRIAA